MDRFQDRAMCYIPQNQNNQNNLNDFNLNIEIKQEIPDIDFEEEKIEDTTTYDDGYHSKCGEIYINNINKEFSLYCSLCNANFINFNLFSKHILYGNHGTQLFFLNNNLNNSSNQISQLYSGREIKPIKDYFQTNINDIQSLPSTISSNSKNFLNIENIRSIKDFREPIDFNAGSIENIKNDLEAHKCNTCLQKFQSNRDLRFHFQICHTDKNTNLPQQSQAEKKSHKNITDNVVPVTTFSLAVCSTPIGKNAPNIRRTRSSSYDNQDMGRTRSFNESGHNKKNSNSEQGIGEFLSSSSSLTSSSTSTSTVSAQIKPIPKYVSKTTTPIIISKSKGSYSTSNKYTGSKITHDTQKVSIIKASATIAEIANNENPEDINANSLSGNCPYCPVKFQKMKYINFHLQKYHPEKILENEIKIKESETCYQCEICNKLFRRLDFYKKHMRKHPKNKHKFVVDDVSSISKEDDVQNNKDVEETAENIHENDEKKDQISIVQETENSNQNILNANEIVGKANITMEHKKSKNKSRKRLKCQYCGKTVLKLNHLILHERKHKITSSVKCRVCEQRYYLRNAYENHMRKFHPDVEYELSEEEIKLLSWHKETNLGVTLQNSKNLILSEEEVNESGTINKKNCKFCPKVFKTVEYRILHEKAHTGTGNFACKHCKQKFNSIGPLWSHQRNCSKKLDDPNFEFSETRLQLEKKEKCNENELMQPSNETSIVDRENETLKSHFKCTYCKKLFQSKSNWVDHVRKHTGEKFECNICDYKTTSPFHLKSHIMKIHDYSKATKNITHEKDAGSAASLNTAIEAATKTSLLKSKLLLQSLAKFDSITFQQKTESFIRLKLFKCKFCQEVYTKKNNLEHHLKKMHLKSKQISNFDLYKCKYCNLRYKTKYQALLHERRHRRENWFACNLCNKSYCNNGYLAYHKNIQHNVGPKIKLRSAVKCHLCNKVFKQLKDLKTHKNEVHKKLEKKEFICEICKTAFVSNELLNSHLTNEHKQFENEEINTSKNLSTDLLSKTEELVFDLKTSNTNTNEVEGNWTKKEKCKVCGNIFAYHLLATHMMTHDIENKPHKCEICSNAFRFKSSLVRHALTVHGKKKKRKQIHLKQCNASLLRKESFSTPKNISNPISKYKKVTIRTLIKDKKIPTINGPPFECPHEGCHKSFGQRLGFNKHYLLHLDTFKCKYCNRCFQTKKVLQKHINLHTEKLPYKCKKCYKAFPVKHALIWHKRRNNCDNPLAEESSVSYSCERCLKSFITKSTLSQHILENTCKLNKNTSSASELQKSLPLQDTDTKIIEAKSKCDTCGKNFLNLSYLSLHYKKTNCVPKVFLPKTLDIKDDTSFSQIDTLSQNYGNSEKNEEAAPYSKTKCNICSKVLENKMTLSWHKRRRVCEVPSDFLCESKFEDTKEFVKNVVENLSSSILDTDKLKNYPEKHLEGEHQNQEVQSEETHEIKKEQYQCEVCLKIFVVKGFLLRHMKYYHPPLIEKNVEDIKKETEAETNESEAGKIENEGALETEENCNRRSTRKRAENENTKYQCQICLKKFETKGLLAGHTRTKACFKSSSCMSALRAQKTALKEGMDSTFKCNLCNKLFTNDGFLTYHIRNQICVSKTDNTARNVPEDNINNIQLEHENLAQVNPLDNSDNQKEFTLVEGKEINAANETISTLENSAILTEHTDIEKYFICKRCNKKFPTKVGLAWHTRRKECFYKRKKYKIKTILSLNQQATKIRKKLIDGIVSSRKISTERKKLRKKIHKAAIQVYKHNRSVAEMADKYQISKTIIYKRVNAFKEMNVSLADLKKKDSVKTENVKISDEKEEKDNCDEENKNEVVKANIESEAGVDASKVSLKLDLTVLRNEKDKNMVKAIRNYIRDRKKGRKLPQRFYCDRYQIRKIHFYRKLFKLGLVRKKGPQKRDPDISLIQEQDTLPDASKLKSEIECQNSVNQTNSSLNESQLSSSFNINEQIPKRKRGRLPKSSEEVVRRAVMDYRMGKGTQLQLCEKYNVGICAFHRVKKILRKELPNLEFPMEQNEEMSQSRSTENIEGQSKKIDTPILPSTNISEQNIPESITDSREPKFMHSQISKKFMIHKARRKIKMMKTGDVKKRRLAIMEACGDLISNRKSKYNMPGTKENVMLMDAISDVVHGIRSFSNAVKHYKISFYTLQRYLDKYKENMTRKKNKVTFKQIENPKEPDVKIETETNCIDVNKKRNIIENINEKSVKKEENSSSSSSSSTTSTSSHSSTSSDDSESESDSDTNSNINKNNDSGGTTSVKNLSSNLNPQHRVIFDPVTGQYIVKKKFEGRGGKGKVRQTVYSKPGTKENNILMKAINEIRKTGESVGYVAKKFQISMQTVSKYIKLFEKQGIIAKLGREKLSNENDLGQNRIYVADKIKSEPQLTENIKPAMENLKSSSGESITQEDNIHLNKEALKDDNKTLNNSNDVEIPKIHEENNVSDNKNNEDNSKNSLKTIIPENQNDLNGNGLSNEDKTENEIQNVLKENSITSIKKDMENVKDFIRKPTYITQKMTSSQTSISDSSKGRTMSAGLTIKQSENFQKDHRAACKSTIEIRKPTYLTQRSSATVIKPSETKLTSTIAASNILSNMTPKISELNKSKVSTKNFTISNQNEIISTPAQVEIIQETQRTLMEQPKVSSDIVVIDESSNESEKNTVTQQLSKNVSEKSLEKVDIDTSHANELIKKEKCNITQIKQHQNIKIRKPTYITQKSCSPNTTIKNTSEVGDNFKQKPMLKSIQKPPVQISQILPSTSHINETCLDRSSVGTSPIIRSQKDIVKPVPELRDQSITKYTSPSEIEMRQEINEDDLIIEHAMRSLLEQDAELDLGNADSTTETSKNEFAGDSDGNSNSNVLQTTTS